MIADAISCRRLRTWRSPPPPLPTPPSHVSPDGSNLNECPNLSFYFGPPRHAAVHSLVAAGLPVVSRRRLLAWPPSRTSPYPLPTFLQMAGSWANLCTNTPYFGPSHCPADQSLVAAGLPVVNRRRPRTCPLPLPPSPNYSAPPTAAGRAGWPVTTRGAASM